MNISSIGKTLVLGAMVMGLSTAHAGLHNSYTFQGNGNWSIDGVGGSGDPVGNLRAIVPTGSTIQQAFLYSSQYSFNQPSFPNPDVMFNGTEISGGSWTPLGVDVDPAYTPLGLQAFRTDVTAQMQAAIGGGSGSTFNFSVDELNGTNSVTDGEVLAIVYANAASPFSTIALSDGFSASSGDSFTLGFGSGLTGVGSSGFQALLSLGIGFSYQPSGQFSDVNVDGRQLTSSAGGQDDGDQTGNGSLITVGGIGDSTSNPDPFANDSGGQRTDDELYDLGQGNDVNSSPFLTNGQTSSTINTLNPSGDDNIFFAGINITADATITTHPTVPDTGSTVALLGLAIAAMFASRRYMTKSLA